MDCQGIIYWANHWFTTALFRNILDFYGTPDGHVHFGEELSAYKQGKGSVQFPLTGEIPYGLIEKIVSLRVKQINSNN